MYGKTLKGLARLTRIDPAAAIKSKRHNPILDSEIHIEEELINLKESLDSYYAAGETIRQYPKVYSYISREKRAIMKHCLGLLIRMAHGKNLPRPYSHADFDEALRRFVQLVVDECRRAGRQVPDDIVTVFRPYLTVRQRVALRDFGTDLVWRAVQLDRAISGMQRAAGLASRVPLLRR